MLLDGTQQAVKHARLKTQLASVLKSISEASNPTIQPARCTFPRRAFSTAIRRRSDALSSRSDSDPADALARLSAAGRGQAPTIDERYTLAYELRERDEVAEQKGPSQFRIRRQGATQPHTELVRGNRRIAKIVQRFDRKPKREETPPVDPALVPSTITSEDIQKAVQVDGRSPALVEVYESINALRPEKSELGKDDVEALSQKLVDGYNKQQLAGYLRLFGSAKNQRKKTAPLARPTISTWRPENSQGVAPAQDAQSTIRLSPKRTIVNEIVRSAWSIKIEGITEERGQMDVQLHVKQIELLCLQVQSAQGVQPFWRTLLVTPNLAKMVKVTPLPEIGILRLEGTQHNTLQVTDELLAACTGGLATVHVPASILEENVAAKQLFADQVALDRVQQATSCLFKMQESGNLTISSLRLQQCFDARRLLYSLIDAETTDVTKYLVTRRSIPLPTVSGRKVDLIYSPIVMPTIAGVPNKTRYRLSTVKPRQPEPVKDVPASLDVGSITRKMEKHVEYADKAFALAISQRHKGIGLWRASIGTMVQHEPQEDKTPRTSAFVYCAPFKDTIFSLFEPYIKSGQKRAASQVRLSAYLNPIQQPGATLLPSIRLQFNIITTWTDRKPSIRHDFNGLTLEFGQQHIQVPLPDKAADMQLERAIPYHLNVNERTVEGLLGSKPLMSLIQNIKANGRNTTVGDVQRAGVYQMAFSKSAMKSIGVDLGDDAAMVQYAFSHIEIRERMEFVPRRRIDVQRHPLSHLLADWAPNTSLTIHERDAGQFGGRHRELFVRSVADGRPLTERIEDGTHWKKSLVREATGVEESQDGQTSEAESQSSISTFAEAEALTSSALCVIEMLSAYRSVPHKSTE